MRIDGDVTTSGSLDVIGKINGNVTASGKLNVTGALEGNLTAAEIYAENARITGEVRSSGAAKIGQSTVILGNIYANSAVIAGAVKGDIDVHGPVVLDTTAIVMGNIKSQSVQINNGAVIEGMCSQSYAEVNPQAFFDGLDG
jgi:cytoskeletal protein CcmA (bactofilin family)